MSERKQLNLPNGWYIRYSESAIAESHVELFDPNDCPLLEGYMMEPERFAEAMQPQLQSSKGALEVAEQALLHVKAHSFVEQKQKVSALIEAYAQQGKAAAVWRKPSDGMPKKPGLKSYEYVDCLIVYQGEVLARPWNCEHEVFDDEDRDDFFCQANDVTAYMLVSELPPLPAAPTEQEAGHKASAEVQP